MVRIELVATTSKYTVFSGKRQITCPSSWILNVDVNTASIHFEHKGYYVRSFGKDEWQKVEISTLDGTITIDANRLDELIDV